MKEEQDYIRDIAEIRSIMEHSTKFLSLSGWAGIMAGMYALAGAWIASGHLGFDPVEISSSTTGFRSTAMIKLMALALVVLFLAIATAVFLSNKKAMQRGEKIWNVTSRRLLVTMAVPLVAGGLLILVLISRGMMEMVLPMTLIFYGLALYAAGHVTYREVRMLGLIELGLGIISAYFIAHSLIIWAVGFGVIHIIYGLYIHYKYEQ